MAGSNKLPAQIVFPFSNDEGAVEGAEQAQAEGIEDNDSSRHSIPCCNR
jgi:hypothetical protein